MSVPRLVLDNKCKDSPNPAGGNDYYGADPRPVRLVVGILENSRKPGEHF